MALMEISIIPLGTATSSVGEQVAGIIAWLQQQGVDFRLEDMGTVIEGPPEKLFALARAMHEIPFQEGVSRVVTHIMVDDRRDKERRLDDKKAAILRRLKQ